MGERNWYQRYYIARTYADEQAAKLANGEEVSGWAYERDWKQGEPEPHKLSLIGEAWVARAYEVAADSALSLVRGESKEWQAVHDECKRLAAIYQREALAKSEQRKAALAEIAHIAEDEGVYD